MKAETCCYVILNWSRDLDAPACPSVFVTVISFALEKKVNVLNNLPTFHVTKAIQPDQGEEEENRIIA